MFVFILMVNTVLIKAFKVRIATTQLGTTFIERDLNHALSYCCCHDRQHNSTRGSVHCLYSTSNREAYYMYSEEMCISYIIFNCKPL